jgi:hypothetical protein
MECGTTSPTGTISGALSACDPQICAVLDTNVVPAWDMYDTQPCNPEHAYFESTIVEYNDISGFAVEIKILLTNDERLWGEDPNANLSDPAITKVSYEPSEETSILNMWGIVADDTLQYIVIPKATWARDVGHLYSTTPELSGKPVQPQVGDVIKTLFNDRNYEITDVGSETAIFNAKKFVWELIVKPYRFAEESDEHRETHMGVYDDPFETLTTDPTGGVVPQNNYAKEVYGDNDFVEEKSEEIDDYRDVIDPDKASFGA